MGEPIGYIHQRVGSDVYCWEVEELLAGGKAAIGYRVFGSGLSGDENPRRCPGARGDLFKWAYGGWRMVASLRDRTGELMTRHREFADAPHPYLDPSF